MNKHLDICFLGGIYPKEYEEEVIKNSKTGIANAANNLQWKYRYKYKSHTKYFHKPWKHPASVR